MEIIFLGTSSGTPTKTRNVSGVAIKNVDSKTWCLVDCGEGTQHQLLHVNLSLKNLDTIAITHVHGDHCYGLPGLLASTAMLGRTMPLRIIAPSVLKTFIDVVQESTQLVLPYKIDFQCIENITGLIESNEFNIEVTELSHRVPSYAYGFYEKNQSSKLDVDKLTSLGIKSGPIWGKIQKGEDVKLDDGTVLRSIDFLVKGPQPRKIIVAGDNDDLTLLSNSLLSANVLVHEATYTHDIAEKVGKGPQHSSAKSVCQFAQSAAIDNLILTHFSPRYQNAKDSSPSIADIEREAKEYYQGVLFLANDFDIFQLNRQGQLKKIVEI